MEVNGELGERHVAWPLCFVFAAFLASTFMSLEAD